MEERAKKAGTYCFWAAVLIELLLVIIDKSAYINPYEGQLFRLTFLLFAVKILTTKYSRNEILFLGMVGMVAAVSYFVNTKDEAVRAVALVAACKDIDLRRLLKVVLCATIAGMAVLFVLSVTGIYGAVSVTADYGRGSGPLDPYYETRYCFGMGHPNAFQGMLFMVSTLGMYLYAERMRLWHFLAVGLVGFVFYLFTDSNTGFIVLAAAVAGVMLMKYSRAARERRLLYLLAALFFIALVAFSAYGSHTGRDTPVMYKIDRVLNGRFQYSNIYEAARVENWKLFGAAANEEFFDQGFIRLFYWYGSVPAAVYLLGNLYLIWQSYHNKDYSLCVIVTAYAVFSMMEAHLVSVYLLRNYLLLFMGYYWYQPFLERGETQGYLWQPRRILLGGK